MAIFVKEKWRNPKASTYNAARNRENMDVLIESYLRANPRIGEKDILTNTKDKNLLVISDIGTGKSNNVAPVVMAWMPFMVDIHLDGKKCKVNFEEYENAEIISLDTGALKILKTLPHALIYKYNIQNLVVNHKLHSIWFAGNEKITDFKYHDGAENEANYESKREIVAGFAAEYLLQGYEMNDDVINIVFRDYWKEHFEHEKIVSYEEALKLLELDKAKSIKRMK